MATTTTDLGKIMLTNGGEYDPETTYDAKTFVLYNGSTYIALKTNVGIEPVDDRVNWQLMARGFMGEEVDIQGYVYVESEEDEEEETVPEPMLDADALGGNPPGYYAPQEQISDEFSEETDYLKGDYCIRENKLYKFTEDKEAGAWDEAKAVPVSVADEITALKSEIYNGKIFSNTFQGTTDINGNVLINGSINGDIIALMVKLNPGLDYLSQVFFSTVSGYWYANISTFTHDPQIGISVSGTLYYVFNP